MQKHILLPNKDYSPDNKTVVYQFISEQKDDMLIEMADSFYILPFLQNIINQVVHIDEVLEGNMYEEIMPSKFVSENMLRASSFFKEFEKWANDNDVQIEIFDVTPTQFLHIEATWQNSEEKQL